MSFSPTYPDICDQAVAFWLAGADMGAIVHAGKIHNNLHYTEVDILEMLGASCSALGATISPNMGVMNVKREDYVEWRWNPESWYI